MHRVVADATWRDGLRRMDTLRRIKDVRRKLLQASNAIRAAARVQRRVNMLRRRAVRDLIATLLMMLALDFLEAVISARQPALLIKYEAFVICGVGLWCVLVLFKKPECRQVYRTTSRFVDETVEFAQLIIRFLLTIALACMFFKGCYDTIEEIQAAKRPASGWCFWRVPACKACSEEMFVLVRDFHFLVKVFATASMQALIGFDLPTASDHNIGWFGEIARRGRGGWEWSLRKLMYLATKGLRIMIVLLLPVLIVDLKPLEFDKDIAAFFFIAELGNHENDEVIERRP